MREKMMNKILTKPATVSSWPQERKSQIISVAVILFGVLYLCLPRLTGWSFNHLHKEDGLIFLTQFLENGWGSYFQTYTGYLHLGPRLITGICANISDPGSFAACVTVTTAGIKGVIAAVALAVFLPFTTRYTWALFAAVVVLFAGVGQQEVLGNITNLRWFLDLAGFLVLVGNFKKLGLVISAGILAFLSATSDPLALIFIPLALWNIFRLTSWSKVVPGLFIAGSITHVWFLNTGARKADWLFILNQPLTFINQVLVRGPVEAVLGENATQIGLNLLGSVLIVLTLIIPAAVIFYSYRSAPSSTRYFTALLILVGLAILSATLLFSNFSALDLNVPGLLKQGSRYGVFPAILISQALILLVPYAIQSGIIGKLISWVFIASVCLGMLADSVGTSYNSRGPIWQQTVIDAKEDCNSKPHNSTIVVPVTPQGVPKKWTATLTCEWVE